MNESQPRRLDLSLQDDNSLPPPGGSGLGVEQPLRTTLEPIEQPSRRPDVLFEGRRPRFEMPAQSEVTRKARDVWEYTRDQAGQLASRVGRQTEELAAQMTCWIRRHPGTSLLCGFSIGFLLADAVLYLRSGRR